MSTEGEKDRNTYAAELADMQADEREAALTPTFSRSLRGFATWSFRDRGGVPCRVQKSSSIAEDLDDESLWLFSDDGSLHLTVDQVRKLLPIFQAFVETGELELPED